MSMRNLHFARKVAAFLVIVMLVFGSSVSAVSVSNNDYATDLYSIGLFKGTEIGFELDRVPTRLEGAVMFVRLLGGEEEALSENYLHPFSDVPSWGNPYVGYLYHYKLTNGISDTEFGTYRQLGANEYITFGLRALGYSDSGPDAQFSWNSSVHYAGSYGIISIDLYSQLILEVFTRGHVARSSYELLLSNPYMNEQRLIDVLVASGSIGVNAAGAVFAEYNQGVRYVPSIGYSWVGYIEDNASPTEEFISRYGFMWHIFGMDYENYIQVGEKDGEVMAVISASSGYGYEKGISIGMTKADVMNAYGDTGLTEIRKPLDGGSSAIIYILDNTDKSTYLSEDGNYITYYYDSYDDDRIVAFLAVDKETEESTHSTLTGDMNLLESANEEQIYHLTNAFRVRMGIGFLVRSIAAAYAARGHSDNMAVNEFFSHTDPEGRGPGDRAHEAGIPFRYLAENIAYGYVNPVDMVNGWFNSQTGHREAMLGDFIYLGIGSAMKDNKIHYCSQEYWR